MAKMHDNPINMRSARVSTVASGHVDAVNNPHNVTKTQVGLSDVDNTADFNKPISTATQNALDLKLESSDITNKLDKNGYTGSIVVVTDVDFAGQSVTTKTISYVDGQITDIS